MSRTLKKILLRLPLFFRFMSFLTRRTPRIFMYHRFCENLNKKTGMVDSAAFEWQLKQLLKGWQVITLSEFMKSRLNGAEHTSYVVVLTIDDGYDDFYEAAFPLLKRYKLPATIFVTVNFVDGGWIWLDRIKFTLRRTKYKKYNFVFEGKTFALDLKAGEKEALEEKLIEYCMKLDNRKKLKLIAKLERDLEVELPPSPPKEFRAITWEQLSELGNEGIEIGSHTLTHPILSRMREEELRDEFIGSKSRIEEKLGNNIASFCYPNGMPGDFNEEVCKGIKEAGYDGAVVAYSAIHENFDPYKIPRTGISDDRVDFLWKLCGMETVVSRLKTFLHLKKHDGSAVAQANKIMTRSLES